MYRQMRITRISSVISHLPLADTYNLVSTAIQARLSIRASFKVCKTTEHHREWKHNAAPVVFTHLILTCSLRPSGLKIETCATARDYIRDKQQRNPVLQSVVIVRVNYELLEQNDEPYLNHYVQNGSANST